MEILDYINNLKNIPVYEIELGVFSEDSSRKTIGNKKVKSFSSRKKLSRKTEKKSSTTKIGVTNAELMYIHEKGSPSKGIPSRPVLGMTIAYTQQHLLQKNIDKAVDAYLNSGFDIQELEKVYNGLALKMENYARDIIYLNDGRLKANSEKVALRKKGNHPLFDTGKLARSITARLIKL